MSERLLALLDEFGLSEYYAALAAENVTPEDLPLLSDGDLAALGLPLGPRRRLQNAVQTSQPVQERRNLTVLFCDMIDSTAIAAKLDPEDLRARYRGFHDICAQVIETEEGYVAQRFGDGVLAYFGFPKALEDAAIRAVRAGLEIVTRMAELDVPGGKVAVRVGVASGLTVVEKSNASGDEKAEIATGATLTMAARLQALAGPGEVMISDATRQLLRSNFELRSIGPTQLKGFPELEEVWQAIGLVTAPMTAPNSQPLLGRDRECAALLARLKACDEESSDAVLLEGEPGIGKSRLLQELRERAPPDVDVLTLHCARYRHKAALHAITDWLETIEGQTRLLNANSADAELLARILGKEPASETLDAAELQAEMLEALVRLLLPTRGRTGLLVVEDLHWADSETLDLLERLREESKAALMILASTRPQAERLPAGFDRIALAPLSAQDTQALIADQDRAAGLPESVRLKIVERAGGVPLFVEELTRAVVESPGVGEMAVPLTLQDTLMARLDRLSTGKLVAQICALIGHSFSMELLETCADMTVSVLKRGLAELIGANLLVAGPGGFNFRHGLVRDVAYGSLVRSERRKLHARVAEVLVKAFPQQVEAQPEQVADHFVQAQNFASAEPYWERAAELALSKAAPSTAIVYFGNALEALAREAATPERDDREVALRIRLNMPLTVMTGFASSETDANLAALAALFETRAPSEAVLQLLWSRSMAALVTADLVSARETSVQLARAATRAKVPNAVRLPDRMLGYVSMLEGELDQAEAHFEKVLDGYAPRAFDSILSGHPFDMLAATLSQHAILMALKNQPTAVDTDQAVALARLDAFQNPATAFQVLVHLTIARIELGDYEGVVPLLKLLRELVDSEQITPLYIEIWEGWLSARSGALDAGLAAMAAAEKRDTQYPLWVPRATLLRVELLVAAERRDEALELLAVCDSEIERLGHRYLRAEAMRMRALCHAQSGDGAVSAMLRAASKIAVDQGAVRFQLNAEADLRRLEFEP